MIYTFVDIFLLEWGIVPAMLFLFTLIEICHILGVTPLELLVSAISWFTFSILVCVKYEEALDISWTKVFIPLFTNIALQWYLTTIVMIRRFRLRTQRASRPGVDLPRYIISIFSLLMILVTEILLVKRLEEGSVINPMLYMTVFVPYFIWLLMIAFFYCTGCTRQQTSFLNNN